METLIGLKRGLLKLEIVLGWQYDMPTAPDANLAAVRARLVPSLDDALAVF